MTANARNARATAALDRFPLVALDRLAFAVSLRLAGPDAVRRQRLFLATSKDAPVGHNPPHLIRHLRRLDELATGIRPPETMQDRLDIAKMERERSAPAFDEVFWLTSLANLVSAGWPEEQAQGVIAETRAQIDQVQHEGVN